MGNDLVDLHDPESQLESLHPRFIERILSPREQEWVCAAAEPQAALWTAWAAKESAYKALKKAHPGLVFSPSRFRLESAGCLLLGGGQTWVRYGDLEAEVEIRRTTEWVHAVATPVSIAAHAPRPVVTEVTALEGGDDESQAVRRIAKSRLAKLLGWAPDDLQIEGRPIPRVLFRGSESGIGLSLSHHGRWVAFAAVLPGELLPSDL